MRHTSVMRCTVVELAAIERAIRSGRHFDLLKGRTTWTKRDRRFLERLRNVRGLLVIEDYTDDDVNVTICGSVRPDGFTRRIP